MKSPGDLDDRGCRRWLGMCPHVWYVDLAVGLQGGIPQRVRQTHGEHYSSYSGEGSCRHSAKYQEHKDSKKNGTDNNQSGMAEPTWFSD